MKLFGVDGFDHLGGGAGGVFPIISEPKDAGSILFISSFCIGSFFTGSIRLAKLRVFGLKGLLQSFEVGVEGSAALNVLIKGFKFKTRSASGLDAFEGGGLYLQNS